MDDLRDRYRAPRRDYAGPVRRPMAPTPQRPPEPAPKPAPPEPAEPHQPSPRHHQPAKPHKRSKKRRFGRLLVFLLVLAALAGGGFFAYQKYSVKNPFPDDIRKSAGIDLLYPTKLPAGYKVDPSSIQQTNGILIFDANNGNQRLVFTLQKTPPTFDFNTFYKQQLQNNQQISTKFGQAAVGKNSGRYLGSLVDGDTWLLLSTNNLQLTANDYNLVLNNLKKY